MIPSKKDLLEVHKRIQPYVHQTPVFTSQLLNEIAGCELYFKCENFQKMGAFKMRGAINAILQLAPEQKQRGVVTHSSGNFGQAVALAAKKLNVVAHIVMPKNAPSVKKEAVQAYGGIVVECDATLKARVTTADEIVATTGATFMHPSNDMDVILGNATAGIELIEKHPDLQVILAPVGGGGLIAGTALAAHYFGHQCKVIGGEPFGVDDAYRSLQSGKIEYNETTHTVADGLRTHLGDQNFPIIKKWVSDIIRVEEKEIIESLQLLWERLKVIIEPSCAVPFAAVLREKEVFQDKKVGIILSGGNIDVKSLPFS